MGNRHTLANGNFLQITTLVFTGKMFYEVTVKKSLDFSQNTDTKRMTFSSTHKVTPVKIHDALECDKHPHGNEFLSHSLCAHLKRLEMPNFWSPCILKHVTV